MSKNKQLKVIDLFAGVGGFRCGLEAVRNGKKEPCYKIVWSNQFEPSTKTQHASKIYTAWFGTERHSNQDIATVHVNDIPDHDLLVGGFPCQDYSVARTLSQASGIIGKKGVLWWEIHRIIREKKNKPSFLLLENVDRLLKSPANQRGRDFAIMLASLSDLGYIVEWRVINAADYGFPQKRRRVFLLGYHRTSSIYKEIKENNDQLGWMFKKGIFARAFPIYFKGIDNLSVFEIKGDLVGVSNSFAKDGPRTSIFENSGMIIGRRVTTCKTKIKYSGQPPCLKEILVNSSEVPEEFYVSESDLKKWEFLKGAKDIPRKNRVNGHEYYYSEGAMAFPDRLDAPARTIVTGEGGSTPSRFKHIIKVNGRYRRLIPVELEKLNMFPPDHTKSAGVSDVKRAFLMGNALVVGVIERLGKQLIHSIEEYS
ncbi:DNA (cytosine-5-)-methyltransferase [Candidatus Omnitrophota bacterium]